jgi:hypothetical protein
MRAGMRHWRLLSLLLVIMAGCGQRLAVDKTVTVEPGEVKGAAIIDAPKAEQKIEVTYSSAESPINVYVILSGDANAVANQLEKGAPKDVVASKEKSKRDTLEATIPAGKEYGVYMSGALKKTEVMLKIKSQ